MAFYYSRSLRVRLSHDLRQYHDHLAPGSEGTLIPGAKCGMWGSEDRFGAVRFDCCGVMLDVLLEGVTILDEDYHREMEQARADWLASLEHAQDVELYLGPLGGFRTLSFRLPTSSYSTGIMATADECLAVFARRGIPVQTIREPREPRGPAPLLDAALRPWLGATASLVPPSSTDARTPTSTSKAQLRAANQFGTSPTSSAGLVGADQRPGRRRPAKAGSVAEPRPRAARANSASSAPAEQPSRAPDLSASFSKPARAKLGRTQPKATGRGRRRP